LRATGAGVIVILRFSPVFYDNDESNRSVATSPNA
jgi:hypothetical protein